MSQTDPTRIPPPLPPAATWPARRRSRSGLWAGAILVLVGVYFLLRNFGVIPELRWDYAWPVLVIMVGIYLLVRRFR